jgi:hypothetical protein
MHTCKFLESPRVAVGPRPTYIPILCDSSWLMVKTKAGKDNEERENNGKTPPYLSDTREELMTAGEPNLSRT